MHNIHMVIIYMFLETISILNPICIYVMITNINATKGRLGVRNPFRQSELHSDYTRTCIINNMTSKSCPYNKIIP